MVDARDGKFSRHRRKYGLIQICPGAKEQHPHTWRMPRLTPFAALRQAKVGCAEVKAIGVVDNTALFRLMPRAKVIRPAKLGKSPRWRSVEITEKLGGLKKTIRTRQYSPS